MPQKFETHRRPKCTVGEVSTRHKTYDLKRYADETLGPVARLRSSYAWQKCRRNHGAKHPLCCDPFQHHRREGRHEPKQHTHHVVALRETLALGLVFMNLRSLCTRCHDEVEDLYNTDAFAAKRLFLSERDEVELRKLYEDPTPVHVVLD